MKKVQVKLENLTHEIQAFHMYVEDELTDTEVGNKVEQQCMEKYQLLDGYKIYWKYC